QESAQRSKEASLAPLAERLKSWRAEKVVFVAPTRGDAARLGELLSHYDLDVPLSEGPVRDLLMREDFTRAIVCGHLHQSFRLPEARLVLVTFDDIFGTRKRQPSGAKNYPSHF